MFGLLGGIYTILSIVFNNLFNFIARRMLISSLISKLYLYEIQSHEKTKDFSNEIFERKFKDSSVAPRKNKIMISSLPNKLNATLEKEESKYF